MESEIDCKFPSEKIENLVNLYMSDTRAYLDAELDVLEKVKSYQIIYDYLDQLPERVRRFVNDKVSSRTDFIELRKEYLFQVSKELFERSQQGKYHYIHGSVPEDIGKTLEKLAEEFFLSTSSSQD